MSSSLNNLCTDLQKQQQHHQQEQELPKASSSVEVTCCSSSSKSMSISTTDNLLNRIKLFLPAIAAANQELNSTEDNTSKGYVVDQNLIRNEFDSDEEEEEGSFCIQNTSFHDVPQENEHLQQQQPKIEMNFVLLNSPMDSTIMACLEDTSTEDDHIDTLEDNGNGPSKNFDGNGDTSSSRKLCKKRLIQEIS